MPPQIIVMGVCGCGKTSVGGLLANALGCAMVEGDDLHPPTNIALMSAGIALTDEDRRDWLVAIGQRIAAAEREGQALILSCSALKRRYRDLLRQFSPRLAFVHLTGDKALIIERVANRPNHFMPTTLVDSQFADLEPLGDDETGATYDVTLTPEMIVNRVLHDLPNLR